MPACYNLVSRCTLSSFQFVGFDILLSAYQVIGDVALLHATNDFVLVLFGWCSVIYKIKAYFEVEWTILPFELGIYFKIAFL